MKVYVATSWRNTYQPEVVCRLLDVGHEVYDFRNPHDAFGFHWSQIDPNWKNWTAEEYHKALSHPLAVKGFECDYKAMEWADAFVLVLPCGRSAHLELGWACGRGKATAILLSDGEPELMNKMAGAICGGMNAVLRYLHEVHKGQSNG